PVGRRLAYDPRKGRLWVVCTRCGRWNLTPLEERWEAIDDAERLFRGTRLRMSTDNIGLACLRGSFELVRIGPALLPEIASWRYGARLARLEPDEPHQRGLFVRGAHLIARATAAALVGYAHAVGFSDDAVLRMRTFRRGSGVLLRAYDADDAPLVVRYSHLGAAELVRPEKDSPWQLKLRHDTGYATLTEGTALRVAGKMLATLNFGVASQAEVQHAIAKLDDAGDPEGYFTRVASLAMRTSWGRYPDAPDEEQHLQGSFAERLALQLANRSFWGRGGTSSDSRRRSIVCRRSTGCRWRWRRTRTSSGARCKASSTRCTPPGATPRRSRRSPTSCSPTTCSRSSSASTTTASRPATRRDALDQSSLIGGAVS